MHRMPLVRSSESEVLMQPAIERAPACQVAAPCTPLPDHCVAILNFRMQIGIPFFEQAKAKRLVFVCL